MNPLVQNFMALLQILLFSALLLGPVSLFAQTMAPWVTRSSDNARSGWNAQEVVLTQTSISSRGMVRVTTIPVYGDARGMEAQPLILPRVRLADGSTHDVMVLPSMANVVRGVDAHSGASLWSSALGANLGSPIEGTTPLGPKPKPDNCVGTQTTIDCHAINDKWGVLSTGVIDPDTERVYLVAWISPDSTPQKAKHYVFVLRVADGSQVVPPVLVTGNSQNQSYSSDMRKQRSSLLLTNINGRKTVFWASGTVMETANGAAGWVFAFDCANNSITASLALSQGRGAGIWMAGQGLAADEHGYLYGLTGNGDFDGIAQFGESFLKLQYTPPSALKPALLKVVDHWTPWTDAARTGQQALAAPKVAGMSAPSEAVKRPVNSGMKMPLKNAKRVQALDGKGVPIVRVYPNILSAAWSDEDWGSAGPACLFSIGICIAAGKDGIGYPVKTASLGSTTLADLTTPKNNCAKLAAPPVWLTVDTGADPCPTNPHDLNFFPNGDTAHLHMTPVQFFDPELRSWTIFAWGENAPLRKWRVSSTGSLTFVAQGHEFASENVRRNNPGGMPGGFCAGSSNGADANSAILACTVPYGDANANLVNGRLLIYDPVHVAPDGYLKLLWDSERWGITFLFNKFDPPVIDGGQIYVSDYNGGVDVYGLSP